MDASDVRSLLAEVGMLRGRIQSGNAITDGDLRLLERKLGALLPPIRGTLNIPLNSAGVNLR